MTPFILAGVVVVVIAGIVWAKVHSGRSERRSMESYGHGLAALGDVAKRSGPSASVRVLPREAVGGTHVRTDVPAGSRVGVGGVAPSDRPAGDATQPTSEPEAGGRAPAGRRPSGPPGRRPVVSIPLPAGDLSFEDRSEEWAGAAGRSRREPAQRAVAGVAPPPFADRFRPSISPSEYRRQSPLRRVTVGAVAVVAVLAIVTAAVLLAVTGGGRTTKSSSKNTHHQNTSPGASTTTTGVTTTTTPPALVKPVSRSGDDATFNIPPGHYTLAFATSSSACWVGIETMLGSGSYRWAETVPAGNSASYKGFGPIAVVLGAPEYLSSVTLNGVPVQIPKGVTTYNLVFASG